MNLAVAAYVFPVIFIGELPDKTMFASLVMSTRGRAGAVWLGAAGAFVVHVIIATTAGVLAFRLLPAHLIDAAVAVAFLAGAVLAARDAWREHRQGARARETETGHAADGGSARPTTGGGSDARSRTKLARTSATAFAVIFVAEWGDLTQMLTASMAARYHSAVSVGVGALLALWSVAALAVLGGRHLSSLLHPVAIRAGTAVLLAGLAGYAALTALT